MIRMRVLVRDMDKSGFTTVICNVLPHVSGGNEANLAADEGGGGGNLFSSSAYGPAQ